jgi:quercetin dioxygenase-like cupin family protein
MTSPLGGTQVCPDSHRYTTANRRYFFQQFKFWKSPNMPNFTSYLSHVGTAPEKFFKATMFRSERLMLGLNCLEPGQVQKVHTHAGQDKFYYVLEGEGEFVVGDETVNCGTGQVVWAPAEVLHGVSNRGNEQLVVLVGIAPAPG